MAEGHSGRLRPGGAVRRGLWTLLLTPIMVVAIPGVATADDVDPNYPIERCDTPPTLFPTPEALDDSTLPATVLVQGTKFPSTATIDVTKLDFTPTFAVTILRDGEKVATATGPTFSVPVTIPRGVPATVRFTAVADEFPECSASTAIRLGCLEEPCLAVTGSDTGGTLWLGLLTLALGAVLVVGARRRTHAPERHRMTFAGVSVAAGPGLLPAPAPRSDVVVSAFAPEPTSAPVPAAVLDRFTVDEQLSLLSPSGPPPPPPVSMGQAVEQLRSLFARLAREDSAAFPSTPGEGQVAREPEVERDVGTRPRCSRCAATRSRPSSRRRCRCRCRSSHPSPGSWRRSRGTRTGRCRCAPAVAVLRRFHVPVADVYVPMPSVPSPSQSPVTGTIVGQTPVPNVKFGMTVPVLNRICHVPLRNTADVVGAVAVEVTGHRVARVSPKANVMLAAPASLVLRNLNVPASNVPGVFEPLPSQSPKIGVNGFVPYV